MGPTKVDAVRGVTILVVVAFLLVLGRHLGQPGTSLARLGFFSVLGGVAAIGAAGVFFERTFVAAGSACVLLLLGFWQAALWVYVFPVSGLLVAAAVLLAYYERMNPTIT